MRRLGILSMVAVVGLALAGPALSQQAVPAGFGLTSQRPLADGVELLTMERSGPNIDAYVARVDPAGRGVLRAVSANDAIPHDRRGLEDPSVSCRRIGCVVAINADFHYPDHTPVGGVVVDGRMLRSPISAHAQLTVTADGGLHAGPLDWTGVLRPSAGSMLPVTQVNARPGPDDLVLFTPAWGERTTFSGGVELVLTSPDAIGTVNVPSRVDMVDLLRPAGGNPIPPDGAVLYASGAFVDAVEGLWNRIKAGTVDPQADLRIDSPLDIAQSVGTSPVLLREGQKVFPDNTFATTRHPRTLLGWNALGEVYLVAIDGRKRDSKGMNLNEASDFLLGLGATEGVNFDGGGGTTFVVDGEVINDPSTAAERASASTLAVVMSVPGDPAPGGASSDPGPGVPGGPGSGGATTAAKPPSSGSPAPGGRTTGRGGVLVASPGSPAAGDGTDSRATTGSTAGTAKAGKTAKKSKAKTATTSKGNTSSTDPGDDDGTGSWLLRSSDFATGADEGDDDGPQLLASADGSLAEPAGHGDAIAYALLGLSAFALLGGLGIAGYSRWRHGEAILPTRRRRRRYY